eukprot:4781383-Alexandrium_andersonii.AAC.1
MHDARRHHLAGPNLLRPASAHMSMERRLDGQESERAVGPWNHFDGRVSLAVPCKSVASAKRACV